LLDNRCARNGPSLIAHEEFKQSKFLGSQINLLAALPHGVRHAVELQIFDLENSTYATAPPAQDGAKSTDHQAGPDAISAANSTSSMAESAKSAVKKAIEPKPLVVPVDTVLAVVLDQTISS
jgi:hypothetical protein